MSELRLSILSQLQPVHWTTIFIQVFSEAMRLVGSVACTRLKSIRSLTLTPYLRLQASRQAHAATLTSYTGVGVGRCERPALSWRATRCGKPCVQSLLAIAAAGISSNSGMHTNRLAKEESPYLLQHAHNPVNTKLRRNRSVLLTGKKILFKSLVTQVDWYPWGQEAFAKASSEDKPIFLSVGYRQGLCMPITSISFEA